MRPGPNRGSSSARSSSIGARTASWYTCLFRSQNAFVFSASSPSKNSNASTGHPRNAITSPSPRRSLVEPGDTPPDPGEGSDRPEELALWIEEAAGRAGVRVPVVGDAAPLRVDPVAILAVALGGEALEAATEGRSSASPGRPSEPPTT